MELVTAKKLSYTVNTVILMLVFGLMGFFHICEVTFLTIFSIPTAMIYLIGYYLIKKERLALYVWAVYFWLTLYMGLTTICLGYGYGFHLYCFSMIPTMFVTEYISYKLNKKTMKIKSMNAIHISGAIAVFYLLCTGYVSIFGPIYNVRKNAATFADENNLWKPSSGNPADFADKAKVTVINRAVGVTGDGVESFIINLYRTAKNMVHGCPGD
ncbi:MAG: hypothetical protein J6A30_01035 [Ruminococcus sp.]|nr:hypothetical protein [Ruminococcus sp.]